MHPPAAPAVPDVLVEDDTHDTPGKVVEGCGGGDQTCSAEDERGVEEADLALGVHARADVDEDGKDGAGEPEPHEAGVELAGGEDALGADKTPDDGGLVEHTAVGAAVVIGLGFAADVFDGGETPVHHGDLDNGGPEGSDHLGGEGDSWGQFHVVRCGRVSAGVSGRYGGWDKDAYLVSCPG